MPTPPLESSVGSLQFRFLLEPDETGGAQSVFEVSVPAEGKVPGAHFHDAFDEVIYGLEGVTRFTLEGEITDLAVGETIFIPRGAVHRFDNVSGAPAKFLATITPAIIGSEYFLELGEVFTAAIAAGGPPDPQAIGAVMLKHGLTPA
jgi:quercetin dioxygenase-like cupin family protein